MLSVVRWESKHPEVFGPERMPSKWSPAVRTGSAQVQALPLPADHQQEDRDIRPLYTFFVAFICSLAVLQGCSSSDETTTDAPETHRQPQEAKTPPPPAPVKQHAIVPSSQQFKVHADTVTAQPKKKTGAPNTSIEVRQTPSKKYFAVQIGAFKLKRNVDHNEKVLEERFHKPVTSFFDTAIQLTRICLGHFATKASASAFLKQMQAQYPNDYTAAWIAELTQ